jgi:hypothetical protein
MHSKRNSLDTLVGYLNATSWPADVDERKLRDRATVTTDPALPGWDIVEVERHRAILGATYTRGQPMSAFETYFMRFAVQLKDGKVEQLPEREDDLDIDVASLVAEHLSYERFGLTIEAVDETRFLIREDVCGDEEIIGTLEEAIAFSQGLGDSIRDYLNEALDNEFGADGPEDEQTRNQLDRHAEEELAEQLKAKAEKAWRDREQWEA